MPQNTMEYMFLDHYIATENNETMVFNITDIKFIKIKILF